MELGGDARREHRGEIRFITYLSPSIPQELFEAIVEHVRRSPGYERISLQVESRISGPERGSPDPFLRDEVDVGFMCLPSYIWLRELRPPPVELLGVAPVFEDARASGRPIYFCDVVVRREAPIRSFAELSGGSWAYNDVCSLSGYYSLLNRLAEVGEDEGFFGRLVRTGSHLRSIEAILRGEADAAAIDSNVLSLRLREEPDLRERLKVIEAWGPFPIQPVVVRSALRPEVKEKLRASLLAVAADPRTLRVVSGLGLKGFVPVTEEDYSLGSRAGGKSCSAILFRAISGRQTPGRT